MYEISACLQDQEQARHPAECSAAADEVLRQVTESGAVAASLWKLEVANVLQWAIRR